MTTQLSFSRTKNIKDIKQRTMANYDIWGKPLSKSGYILKVLINGFNDNYMDENHWYYYTLKNEMDEIESSLEILLRNAWIKTDGEIKIVNSGVIGSVFTDVKFRGKGNIEKLMNELHNTIDIDIFFLYSELGDYYSKFSYKSENVPIWSFKSILNDKINNNTNYIFNSDGIETIVKKFKQKLFDNLNNDTVCLIPNVEMFEWFNNRSRVTFWDKRCPTYPQPIPIIKNVITDAPYDQLKYGYNFEIDNELQYILWYVDYSDLKMSILLLEATTANSLKSLLKAALNYAKIQSIDKVELWDLEDKPEGYLGVLDELSGIKIKENSSLSAVKFKSKQYKWQGNGKWCWF